MRRHIEEDAVTVAAQQPLAIRDTYVVGSSGVTGRASIGSRCRLRARMGMGMGMGMSNTVSQMPILGNDDVQGALIALHLLEEGVEPARIFW